jgi:hypothetical protein
MGVSFDLNEALPNIGRPMSTRRNTRFMGRGDKMEQNNDVGLTTPPMKKRFQSDSGLITFCKDYSVLVLGLGMSSFTRSNKIL